MHFSNCLVRAGAEEHILTLLKGLDRERFRLSLTCTPEVARKLGADVPSDVEVFTLTLRKPGHLAAAWRLAGILRSRRVDILHSHLFYASLFASPIGRLCGVPVVVETPHVREHWRRGWLKGRFVVDRAVGRSVDHYVAVSEANARYLVETKGLPRRKVMVIRNGSDLTRFRPGPGDADLRRRLGFGAADPVLAVIGRLEPQKGHRFLLAALPAVRAEFPTVRLVCVGEGSLREELEATVARGGLQEAVRFVGYQEAVTEWVRVADVTVLPSLYEGLPLAAIESLAVERPVVATAVDGTPEVVLDGKTGLTVPPGDPAGLAAAVCRLLRDRGLRQELARAGRSWVLERFSQERQVRETQDFYLAALARRRRWARRGAGAIPFPASPAASS
jgi:glycosyltransferase involved in cell wall biosynthesis